MNETPSAPFTAYIGAIVEAREEGYVRLALPTDTRHADRNGWVHGGALTVIMDSVIGIALGNLRGPVSRERPHATIGMTTTFHERAMPGDEIVAEGRITQIAELYAVGDVEARRRSDGELIASARLTFAIPRRD